MAQEQINPFVHLLDRETARLACDWADDVTAGLADDAVTEFNVVQMQRLPEGDVFRTIEVAHAGHRHVLVLRVAGTEEARWC